MEKAEYNEFIEPYLQEAENNLIIGRYCKENYESRFCEMCLAALVNYNVACFHDYAKIYTKTAKQRLELYKLHILGAIEKIKNEMGLTDLDVNEELQKTCGLFYQANVAFYKRLSLATKATLWFLPKSNSAPGMYIGEDTLLIELLFKKAKDESILSQRETEQVATLLKNNKPYHAAQIIRQKYESIPYVSINILTLFSILQPN